jgi:Ni2+-binding GTPase involved in maturation of urease and hydrogenase
MTETTHPPVVSIVGRSKSGKTTLIEKLIPLLKARGYRVGTVKHHAHPGFDIDIPWQRYLAARSGRQRPCRHRCAR